MGEGGGGWVEDEGGVRDGEGDGEGGVGDGKGDGDGV